MPYQQRKEWILNALLHRETVSILDTQFLLDYSRATGIKVQRRPQGDTRCLQLRLDLTAMFEEGLLHRWVKVLHNSPSWVYTYSLSRTEGINYHKFK